MLASLLEKKIRKTRFIILVLFSLLLLNSGNASAADTSLEYRFSSQLVVTDIWYSAVSFIDQNFFEVGLQIDNLGFETTIGNTASLYLSTDTDITPDDFFIGRLALSAVEAGESLVEHIDIAMKKIPPLFQNGYIIVIVDGYGGESMRVNPVSFDHDSFDIPDLVITDIYLPYNYVAAGDWVDIDLTITNNGRGAAPSSPADIYLTFGQNSCISWDYLVETINVGPLLPFESAYYTVTFEMPAFNGCVADPKILVELDVFDDIYESFENNQFISTDTLFIKTNKSSSVTTPSSKASQPVSKEYYGEYESSSCFIGLIAPFGESLSK